MSHKEKEPRRTVHRDLRDGQFVTERYSDQHPSTTERERVPVGKPPKK